MTKPKTVVVDVFYMLVATTGVRTYINELLAAIQDSETRHHYRIFPASQRMSQSTFFKGRMSGPKKVLFHLSYFLYKQLFLPIYCALVGVDVLLSPDYFAPRFTGKTWKITVIHDAFFWEHPENYNTSWLKYFIKQIKGGITGNSVVVTTSNFAKAGLQKVLSPQVPIEVVYQSADLFENRISGDGPETLARYGLREGAYLLHVGYFDKRKNLPTLVKAYADLKSSGSADLPKLVLVGDRAVNDVLDDHKQVVDLVEAYSLDEDVILTGRLPLDELATVYRHALLYVFPSYNEGFGIPILEAFYYGLPLIVSDRGALSEIAGDAAVVFQAFDEKDLSKKMQKVLNDRDLRKSLISIGQKRRALFSRSKFIEHLEEVIDQYVP